MPERHRLSHHEQRSQSFTCNLTLSVVDRLNNCNRQDLPGIVLGGGIARMQDTIQLCNARVLGLSGLQQLPDGADAFVPEPRTTHVLKVRRADGGDRQCFEC
jgi:hypothetical protein